MHIIFDEFYYLDTSNKYQENQNHFTHKTSTHKYEGGQYRNNQHTSMKATPRSWKNIVDHLQDQMIQNTTNGLRIKLNLKSTPNKRKQY